MAISLSSRLLNHAARHPDKPLFSWLERNLDISQHLSIGDFALRVERCAALLAQQTEPGDRVLLLLQPGLDFAVCFMACLHAGCIAVPLYPPSNPARKALVAQVTLNCAPLVAWVGKATQADKLTCLTPAMADDLAATCAPRVYPIAFLQYTSGSVAAPKGVIITQANLSLHADLLERAFGVGKGDVGLSWLPPYHDMGLIGCVLQPIWLAEHTYLMSPMTFVRQPLRWLEAIAKFGATISGAPNFAYRWCSNIPPEKIDALDLSRWRVAFCGAEPIQPQTLKDFATRYEPAGFTSKAFLPCYGLAEATLLVAGHTPGSWHEQADCGQPAGVDVRIVDAQGLTLRDGKVGEIEVSGPTVSAGYWNNPAKTADAFRPAANGQRWLRTGDLGRLAQGRLEIQGRVRDLVIIQGRNLFPEDVERVLYDHADIAAAAAFGLGDGAGSQRLVLLLEWVRTSKPTMPDLMQLRAKIAVKVGVTPAQIGCVRAGQLPRTTSGKIQRSKTAQLFANHQLKTLLLLEQHGQGEQAQAEMDSAESLWRRILGLNSVSPELDFHVAGGDSRKAAALLVQLEQHFNVALDFEWLEAHRQFKQFAKWFDAQSAQTTSQLLTSETLSSNMPLTSVQRRIWLEAQQLDGSGQRQLLWCLTLESPLDTQALTSAFSDLQLAFPHFAYSLQEDREIHWQVGDPPTLEISNQPSAAVLEQLQQQPLDPHVTGVRSVYLATENKLILAIHHLYIDGASANMAWSYFQSCYAARTGELVADLQQPMAYHHAADALMLGETKRLRAFWQPRIEAMEHQAGLPFDFPQSRLSHADYVSLDLKDAQKQKLGKCAHQLQQTPFAILNACLHLTLRAFCGDAVGVWTAFANRHKAATSLAAGPVFEIAPVFLQAADNQSFSSFTANLHRDMRRINDHLTDATTLRAWDTYRHLSRSQVLLMHQVQPQRVQFGTVAGRLESIPQNQMGAALEIALVESEAGWQMQWFYRTACFSRATITALVQTFLRILERALADPHLPLWQFQAKPAAQTAAIFSPNLETLFKVSFAQHEKKTALQTFDPPIELSYAALEQRSQQLAAALTSQGIGIGSKVALHLERGHDAVLGMLALLRVGAAFVPLPPDMPPHRAAWILQHSGVMAVLTNHSDAAVFEECQLELPKLRPTLSSSQPQPWAAAPEQALAYVMYTSGSTGLPKGVCVSRAALAHFLGHIRELIGVRSGQRLLAMTALSFDISLLELLLPLTCGSTVVMAPDYARRDGAQIDRLLRQHAIDIVQATPATYRLWCHHKPAALPKLTALCGGERLDANLAESLLPQVGHLINLYGPTETTVWSSVHAVNQVTVYDMRAGISLGEWLPGLHGHVVSNSGALVPVHGVGELYLSGPSLAQGYAGLPRMTAAAFLPCPFSQEAGARWYRTGDLVRMFGDGELRFLRRVDRQVKLRGYRIELGEIEAALLQKPEVKAAVVLLQGSGEQQRIEAHVESESDVDARSLRHELQQRLPDYMIPSSIVRHAAFPLTSSLKIDRRRLMQVTPPTQKTRPESGQEAAVLALFRATLAHATVDMDTSFFAAGGHSLLALKLRDSIASQFGVEVPMRVLFERATPQALADWLAQTSPSQPVHKPLRSTPAAPLMPSMEPIWLWQKLNPTSSAYHLAAAIKLAEDIELDDLANRIRTRLERHEALRLRVAMEAGLPVLKLDEANAEVLVQQLSSQAGLQAAKQAFVDEPFKIEAGDVFRAKLFITPKHRELVIVMHHLVCDGWSLGLLLQDLDSQNDGEPASMLALAAGRADFLRDPDKQRWWHQQLRHVCYDLALPQTPKEPGHHVLETQVSPADHAAVVALAAQLEVTPALLYMLCYQWLLAEAMASDRFAIGVPVANRKAGETHTVGMFSQMVLLPFLQPHHDLQTHVKTLQAWFYQAQDWVEHLSLAQQAPRVGEQHQIGAKYWFWFQDAPLRPPTFAQATMELLLPKDPVADLVLEMRPSDSTMQLRWLFDHGHHGDEQAQALADRWVQMIRHLISAQRLPELAFTFTARDIDATQAKRHLEAPKTEEEERVASIWRELLGTQALDRNDDFFQVGGHSLLAMRLAAALNQKVAHRDIGIEDVFTFRTIASQAALLMGEGASEKETLEALLDQLDQMSDEEAAALLKKMDV